MTINVARTERSIIRLFCKTAIAAGHTLSYHDGEDFAVKRSRKVSDIMKEVQSTDYATIVIRDNDGERIGSIILIYGNDGYDVIADHSDTDAINALLIPANTLAERIETRA